MDGRPLELVELLNFESNVLVLKTGADVLDSMTGSDVDGAFLTGANVLASMTGADVVGAFLTGANVLASMTGADVVGAFLTGANVLDLKTGADVDGAFLTGDNVLDGVFLQIYYYYKIENPGGIISGSGIEDLELISAKIIKCLGGGDKQ